MSALREGIDYGYWDADAVAREAMRAELAKDRPVDPLDVEYDGVKLRELVRKDELARQERGHPFHAIDVSRFTPAQRAAVSAHWSAQLRAKVAASKAAERNAVLVDLQDEP